MGQYWFYVITKNLPAFSDWCTSKADNVLISRIFFHRDHSLGRGRESVFSPFVPFARSIYAAPPLGRPLKHPPTSTGWENWALRNLFSVAEIFLDQSCRSARTSARAQNLSYTHNPFILQVTLLMNCKMSEFFHNFRFNVHFIVFPYSNHKPIHHRNLWIWSAVEMLENYNQKYN